MEEQNIGEQNIVFIPVCHIYPHPENPRKSLGDLAELTESVRKNGIMQNLTVIPVEEKPGDYYTLIGNRRQEATKLAGLESLPCRIVRGLDRREQLSIMLEENMQRTDLTISEQAQSFQMMLDLGETEETIAEKTGFSRTTIRHRLNIAKLNQKELQKKEQDTSFQLTMKDLYELEKVKDIKTRNRILKEATTSHDLVYRAQSAVSEAKRKSSERAIARLLEKLNVEKAPDGANIEIYGGKWRTVIQFDLEEDPPGEITLPEHDCQLYYLTSYRTLRVIRKAPKEKKELTDEEKTERQVKKQKKQLHEILKESTARRREFIRSILSGKIQPVRDENAVAEAAWASILELGCGISRSALLSFLMGKETWQAAADEKKAAMEKATSLSTAQQMLVFLHRAMENTEDPFDYSLHFLPERGAAMMNAYKILELYGWYFESDDEK